MASLSSTTVTIPQFTGLKPGSTAIRSTIPMVITTKSSGLSVKASLKDVGVVVVATATSAVLAGNVLAMEVLLGGDDGSLAFVPNDFTISAGEKIVFKNNAGFPHNVVFDEDEVPEGVNAAAISMDEENLLNSAGEEFSITLKEKGTYSFYCAPHQGAGMVGKVTVN